MPTDPNANAGWLALIMVWVSAAFEQMHPMSAIGASFGCMFFILLPDPVVAHWKGWIGWSLKLLRKFVLTVLSWGFGYSVGILFFNNASMLMAILGGALGSTILGVLNLMIKNDADLPPWLTSGMNAILRIKRGSDEQ
ncbi:hypothetical protein uan_074 [Pseudomonas phage UAntarctica]|nr:hypothetical protein uan_074 [Pseudomonas phage UAntarctica]